MNDLESKNGDVVAPAAGIYVHVPFCRAPKCAYCDFYSEACDRALVQRFAVVLADEFTAALEDPYWRSLKFGSVFFGGGTPSLLDSAIIAEWIGFFRKELAFEPEVEITLECNPEDLNRNKAGELLGAGVNRLSVGCQSFDPAVLDKLGRCHSPAAGRRALEAAAGAGFGRVSADLIIASPGSSVASTLFSIETALELGVEHLAIYGFHLEPGAAGWGRTGYGPLADEAFRGQYLAACVRLDRETWRHYEISNWACNDRALCRHNLGYWRRRPYLGLGPSAHSFIPPERRFWNLPDLDLYLEAGEQGAWEKARGGETLNPGQITLEKIMLALRLDSGLSANELARLDGPVSLSARAELENEGLVRRDEATGAVFLSPEGFLVYDSVVGRLAAEGKVSA